ncbi:hypothetical protein TRVL_04467 [Trypanosoma vivax]|uniref:Uncharacterized protein n=1 Tax=Trypanosoma vivax (strain Y486) TaxID=1055687 RepID=G0UAK6_TRYVY|nr:hypothetical protein TRVL_04467 [Trypanosoma vivax]CCC52839.1 conserved hypothetical protein [Trypanosoma vivax Y486]
MPVPVSCALDPFAPKSFPTPDFFRKCMSRKLLERCPKRHLVIHMDINKTIVQFDSAGGRSLDDTLNSNAAANVWGRVVDGKWEAVMGPDEAGDRSNMITFAEYVDQKYAEPPGMRDLPRSARDRTWKEISGRRRAEVGAFTCPGQPGEKYKHLVDKQKAVLDATPNFSVIPSFFEFVNTLSELGWSFTLIFRTFGNDLGNVLKEWKQFLFGEHAHQPRGHVLQQLRETYVCEATGCIFRDKDRLFLCYGPRVGATVTYPEGTEELSTNDIVTQLKGLPSCREVRQVSFSQLHDQFVEYAATSNGIAGIIDYYPFWAQAAERRSGGKVYPVNITHPSNCTKPYLYAFFDDNIRIGEEHSIVDLRDVTTGASIMDFEMEKKYTIGVNSYQAIVYEDYFLDCLADALRLQLGEP